MPIRPLVPLALTLLLGALPTVLAPEALGQDLQPVSRECTGYEPSGPPVEQRALALLAAVCDGSEATLTAFVAEQIAPALVERLSADRLIGMLQGFHTEFGRAEIVGARVSSEIEGRFALALENGGETRLELTLDPEAPHRIAGFGVEAGPSRPALQFASLDEALAYLADEAEAERFSGVVLVARDGEPLVHQAYGWADYADRRLNTVDTRFNIGSMDKDLTSTAVLQLVERGQLDLDTPIGAYMEGFPPEVAERVTVRHLLQHRSGWGHYWDHPVFLAQEGDLVELDDYLAFLRTMPLDFEPGTRQQYSNTGFEVLGGLIEAVSGLRYHDYVAEHIARPAGMTDTGGFPHTVPRLATPYLGGQGYGQPMDEVRRKRGTAAGGGYSTTTDWLRFQEALADGRLLGPEARNLFFSNFETTEDTPVRLAFAGGAPGINAVWLWDGETAAIVVVNMDPPLAETVGSALFETAGGRH